ncbi:hypothetical protein P5G51_008675 [Virgibacillus sp. 179-BFC.A HS]|uniref:Spore coat protein n=1 Tax=Tigheibacillus jepli TaxID=3035914 RepID=A0ABU5CI00_9BACI|nr:hypothetical protein [Virgibacillus sp. 179-BFC.A HS]MDY0405462.1 hypothetical protein [Virgibacillus sp. 179-BFC.A HS]
MPQMPPPIEMPIQQMTPVQMPIMEQEMSNYTTINMPAPPPPKEKVKKEVPKKEKKVHYKPMPQPQMPMCCYVMYPCCPPMHHGPWHHAMPMAMPYPHYAPEVFGGYAGPAPMMEMPVKPEYGAKDDCGCHSHGNFHFMHDFREQEQPAPESMNYYPPHAQVDERGYPTPPAYQSFPEDETESGNE